VVNFLAPYIKECITKERAIEVMNNLLTDVEKVCDEGLTARGFNYGSRASIRQEKFPTRVYGDLTLEEGIYDALIIELGTGEGDNWWCVIYPPLCFTSADTTIEYRSAIWEIIKKWQNK
jgi:stage II sporulation protein R